MATDFRFRALRDVDLMNIQRGRTPTNTAMASPDSQLLDVSAMRKTT
jgi:hypothetical protein